MELFGIKERKFMKKVLIGIVVLLSLSTSAFSFERHGIKEGVSGVDFSMRYSGMSPDYGDDSNNIYTARISGGYAYFLTDSVELGLGLGYTFLDGGAYKNHIFTLTPSLKYNFTNVSETMVPYIGIGVSFLKYKYRDNHSGTGYTPNDGDYSDTAADVELGLKVFAAENFAVVPALYSLVYENYTEQGLKVGFQFLF